MNDTDLKRCVLLAEQRLLRSIPPDELLSHRFSPSFSCAMNRLIRRMKHPTAVNTAIRFSRRAVLVALAALIAALGVAMSVGAWRDALFQFLEQQFPAYLRVSFAPNDPADSAILPFSPRAPGWLPDGFVLLDTICNENEVQVWSHGADGGYLQYRQYPIADAALLTNPGTESEPMQVNGGEARCYELPHGRLLLWEDDASAYLLSANIDRAALRRVAENLQPLPGMFVSQMPGYLPPGFVLTDSLYGNRVRLGFQGNGQYLLYQQLWLSDGENLLYLTEMDWRSVEFMGHPAREMLDGDYATLTWTDDTYYYSVASNAGREEVWRVAESLRPNRRAVTPRAPTWLPDGWREVRRSGETSIFYESADGQSLAYRQDPVDSTAVYLDDIAGVTESNLNGHGSYYYPFAAENILLWYDGRSVYQLCAALDEETLTRIAKSVR